MKRKIQRILDPLMIVVILFLMGYHFTGQLFHELAGALMILMVLVHTILNWRWYQQLRQGKYNRTRIYITMIDLALLVEFILLAWSGITMSGYVFSFIPFRKGVAVARRIHLAASNWSFMLIGMHLGNHWNRISAHWQGKERNGLVTKGCRAITFCAVIAGGVCFLLSGMVQNMLFLSQFDNVAREASAGLFFIKQFLILAFFVALGNLCFQLCSGKWKTLNKKGNKDMDKKKKKWMICLILIGLVAVLFYFLGIPYIRRHFIKNELSVEKAVQGNHAILQREDKILTVYFTRLGNSNFEKDVDVVSSASLIADGTEVYGNSQVLAEMVQNIVGGDVYTIETEKKYPSSYMGTVKVANDELDNDARPKLSSGKVDILAYDTIVLVYPVWWNHVPMPVATFLEQYDFEGKTILPIATHGGSGTGSSIEDLKKMTKAKIGKALTIYDDEVGEAREKIVSWLGMQ